MKICIIGKSIAKQNVLCFTQITETSLEEILEFNPDVLICSLDTTEPEYESSIDAYKRMWDMGHLITLCEQHCFPLVFPTMFNGTSSAAIARDKYIRC
jgi:hypothetical protein